MIRVERQPEPADFDTVVRAPGKRALLELIGDPSAPKRPGPRRTAIAQTVAEIPSSKLPDYWTTALPWLRTAYHDICAYLGMPIHRATGLATVDHFKPKSKHQTDAYEWDNFRLASHQVNTNKGEHEDVLDPFDVEDGWFALEVGSFEIRPAPSLDPARCEQVRATIERLKLNEPTFCLTRAEYHDFYLGLATHDGGSIGPLSIAWLDRECPYVASELRRQGRLRPDDRVTS